MDMVHDDLMGKAGSGSLPRVIPSALGLKQRLEFQGSPTVTPMPNLPG